MRLCRCRRRTTGSRNLHTTPGTTDGSRRPVRTEGARGYQLWSGRNVPMAGSGACDVVSRLGHGMINGGHYIASGHPFTNRSCCRGNRGETSSVNQGQSAGRFRRSGLVGSRLPPQAAEWRRRKACRRINVRRSAAYRYRGSTRRGEAWGGERAYDEYGVGDRVYRGEGPERDDTSGEERNISSCST